MKNYIVDIYMDDSEYFNGPTRAKETWSKQEYARLVIGFVELK